MTAAGSAPRSPETPAGGGAPAPSNGNLVADTGATRAAALVALLHGHLEVLDGHRLGDLAPYADDLADAADILRSVTSGLGSASTPPPRPAPRHDTAVASAVGVLVPAGPELEDLPDAHDDLEAERGRRIEGAQR